MNNVLKLFLFLASILVFGLVFGISESFADEQEIRKIEGIYELKNPPLHPLETIFEIPYKITNATLNEIRIEHSNIVIEINSTDNGLLEADIPKNLHYVQRNEEPTRGHFIIIDGEEIFAEQIDNQCVISYSIPFAKGSRSIEILSSFTPDNTPIIPYKPPTNCLPKVIQDGLSPLKQIAKKVLPKDVVCREKLELIFKSTNNSPACVKLETAIKLYKRGWAKSMENDAWQKWAENVARNFVISNLDSQYEIIEDSLKVGNKGQRDSLPPRISVGIAFSALDENGESVNLSFDVLIIQGDKVEKVQAKLWDENWENWEVIPNPFIEK